MLVSISHRIMFYFWEYMWTIFPKVSCSQLLHMEFKQICVTSIPDQKILPVLLHIMCFLVNCW